MTLDTTSSPAAGPARRVDRLAAIYGQITEIADSLTPASGMLPSRCAAWTAQDVLYHQLLDARRALIAFATSSDAEPDVDGVTYWKPFGASEGGPAAPGGDGAARHARHVRIAAAAYEVPMLAGEWRETSAAAVRAALACPHEAVATQGHTLATASFIDTLVVEAAVHYLDLTVSMPAAPAADQASLALVREVLAGLAGRPMPTHWDDETAALKGTGRLPVTEEENATLGAGMLPLLG
jgi:Mycothiol maleylpyruvate isomerase N-terminal domain